MNPETGLAIQWIWRWVIGIHYTMFSLFFCLFGDVHCKKLCFFSHSPLKRLILLDSAITFPIPTHCVATTCCLQLQQSPLVQGFNFPFLFSFTSASYGLKILNGKLQKCLSFKCCMPAWWNLPPSPPAVTHPFVWSIQPVHPTCPHHSGVPSGISSTLSTAYVQVNLTS